MRARGQFTIVDLNDPIQQGTEPENPTGGMLWLDTSLTPPLQKRYNGTGWEMVNEAKVGGVNLIAGSASRAVAAMGNDSYWIAADELRRGKQYVFSVEAVRLDAGTASGASWAQINQNNGSIVRSGTLAFSENRQSFPFVVPDAAGNWSLYLYAGIHLNTTGVTVTYVRCMQEEGNTATTWAPAPEDTTAQIEQLIGQIGGLDAAFESRVRTFIDALELDEQFTSVEAFQQALNDIELIRSELAQTDSNLTLAFSRLLAAEGGISQMFTYFEFGDAEGIPYLDMGSSASSVKMRQTNTRLAFVQAGQEQAYFSDNKLYVTRLEAVEQISIGTAANGYLDIMTTPTGIGLKWRT